MISDILARRTISRPFIRSGIDLAQSLAEYIHIDQLDKQGKPYIDHVNRVYNSCRSLSVEQRIAALLHDSLEDARPGTNNEKVDAHAIHTLFGDHVLKIVMALTRYRGYHEQYSYYIKRLAQCPDAILIKLADLNDNLNESRGPIEETLRQRYLKAKEYLELCVAKGGTEK